MRKISSELLFFYRSRLEIKVGKQLQKSHI